MVCAGETYESKIVRADHLLEAIAEACYSPSSAMPDDERREWEQNLADDDNWSHSQDFRRTHFGEDIGEIDRFDFYLITGLAVIGVTSRSLARTLNLKPKP